MQDFKSEARACLSYFGALSAEIRREQECIVTAGGVVDGLTLRYPLECPALAAQARLYNWLLRPMLADGFELLRVGGRNDGGYLMAEPGQNGIAYSLGIAEEVSWDLEMAGRGFEIWQYDGSVAAPPVNHAKFNFSKLFITGQEPCLDGFVTLPDLLAANCHTDREDLVLQMDIEGAEWQVLANIAESALNSFRQIILEIHTPLTEIMQLPRRNAILRRLGRSHQVIHAHVNNCSPTLFFGAQPFWTVIELTYLRRGNIKFNLSPHDYPLPLDAPCEPRRTEIRPGKWGFLEL